MDENRGIWLTPTGAGIALICFFLPWIEFSCGTMTGSISGAEMGGVMWVVFVAALLSLLAFYYFRNYDELDRAKPVVVLSGLTAIAIMVYKFFNYKSGVGCCQGGVEQLGEIPAMRQLLGNSTGFPNFGFSIKFGAYGTFAGFLLALIGAHFLDRQRISKKPPKAVISYYSESLQKRDRPPSFE
ncbi:MAG: hypothetical protein GX409_11965 [candidate division Zixibacteria bacterium]|nr:hypothetical protein [candidate division Zixibacteria bacterium]